MPRIKFTAIKRPESLTRLQGILVEYNGEEILFRPKAILVGDVFNAEKLMSSVNLYMSNMDDDDHAEMFKVYSGIRDIRDAPKVTHSHIFELDKLCEIFFNIVTCERLTVWGHGNDEYATASSIDSLSPMKDNTLSHSCDKKEYIDLAILSTLFKFLIPFQELAEVVAEALGSVGAKTTRILNDITDNWSLFAILDAYGVINEYPAYIVLRERVISKSESLIGKGVPTGLTALGIGEETYYKIILVTKLFRDVTRLETELTTVKNGANNNISFKANLAIRNYIQHDIAPPYKFNTAGNTSRSDDEGGNTTRNELKPGGERISSIYGMYFLKDYMDLIDVIKHSKEFPEIFKFPEKDILARVNEYPDDTPLSKEQSTLLGNLFHDAIPIDSEDHRPLVADGIMLAYGSLIFEKYNLPNLYAFTSCRNDEHGVFTETETRNNTITAPYVHPLTKDVVALYESDERGDLCTEFIDPLIKSIARTNYVISVPHNGLGLGDEWFPKLIENRGIKDEMIELLALLHGVKEV